MINTNTNVLAYGFKSNNISSEKFNSTITKEQKNYIEKENTLSDKITFKEGAVLFGEGMLNHIKDIGSSIVKHPVKTAISGLVTTSLLFALPLIGIPTVTAASFMALGFAGFSVCKGAKHIAEFIKNNKNQDYDKARNNLGQLGADTLDIAMSAPAVPKAIKNVSSFTKYGKIGINSAMISDFKSASGIKGKIGSIKSANSELTRSINYQTEIDKAIANLTDCSEVQKAEIREHLLRFNVPDEQIPQVVLDRYSEITGISAQPNLELVSFENKDTRGMACRRDCRISIKSDAAEKVIPATRGNGHKEGRYKFLDRKLSGNEYINTYEDLNTGEKISERVNKDILDDFRRLSQEKNTFSPQASTISTTLHERRHVHQYVRMAQTKGLKFLKPTAEAERIYSQMLQEMSPLEAGTAEAGLVQSWIKGPKGKKGLIGTYISNPLEVDARNFQAMAHKNQEFQMLDGIYKQMNKIVPENIMKAVLPNYLKAQSVVANETA